MKGCCTAGIRGRGLGGTGRRRELIRSEPTGDFELRDWDDDDRERGASVRRDRGG